MLKVLRIKNYALVDDLEVEFYPGLNIITGATGAGKSIIVGAVNLILGERASSEAVRTGFDAATIEAVFELQRDQNEKATLEELGITVVDDSILIRREILSKGQSKCYVNDRLVTLSSLKSIGDRLADLHGQHEHQSLLNIESHIGYLDQFGDLGECSGRVRDDFHRLMDKQKELEELLSSRKMDLEKRSLYEFQMQEIERADLNPDEEDKLLEERKVLENVELLFELSSNLYHQLYENEASILERITLLSKELNKGAQVDSRLKDTDANLESLVIKLQEIIRFLEDYKNRLEFDAERLEAIRERLNLLSTLKKKYGKNVRELLTYQEQIKIEMERIENKDELIGSLECEIKELSKILVENCLLLSRKRKSKAAELSQKIKRSLADLGMERIKFDIRIMQREVVNGLAELDCKRYQVTERGMDEVEFFVSPNPGEELKPLAKIASGGEISRIMLALKSILAKTDQVSSMIFDEIDVGIGGEVASVVGKALKNLGLTHQVIVITHLQQIASQADHHFKVFKETVKGRTVSRIKRLEKEEQVKEIARMISGEKISEVTMKQAQEMIRISNISARD
ncbi:MAG: DNA repair protein RecN [Candidatus Zixiibacteriota bacterium]